MKRFLIALALVVTVACATTAPSPETAAAKPDARLNRALAEMEAARQELENTSDPSVAEAAKKRYLAAFLDHQRAYCAAIPRSASESLIQGCYDLQVRLAEQLAQPAASEATLLATPIIAAMDCDGGQEDCPGWQQVGMADDPEACQKMLNRHADQARTAACKATADGRWQAMIVP